MIKNIKIKKLIGKKNINPDPELISSIRKKGIINPLLVRENLIIDGNQRYSAALAIGLKIVPCNIIEATDAQLTEHEAISSVNKINIDPIEYAKQLKCLIKQYSINEVAQRIGKSVKWINKKLSLLENNNEQ